ncbi:MAG: rhomboid family intramembrane serine protease [Vulcanimicrobiaceae bacterium]
MITRILILINALVFLWELQTGALVSPEALVAHGGLLPAAVLQDHQYWRIVTGAFLHAGWLHIGLNMLSLWWLGSFIERILGSPRTLLVYAVSLVVSGFGVVYFSSPDVVTIGASGAIFGLFGALFAIGVKYGPPGMALIRANLGILLINLAATFLIPEISKAAHVAGLLAGFLLTLAIFTPPVPVRTGVTDVHTGGTLDAQYEDPDHHRNPFTGS